MRVSGAAAPALAAAAALVVHLLAAFRPDGRAPTDGEARLAAAVFAVGDGRLGVPALAWSDRLAARQLAVVTAVLPGSAGGVWDTVRLGTLALGVVSALLVWAVLRRLGCAGGPTALAVTGVGVTPPALALHGAATATAVAVPWLLLAALLCWRGRVLGAAAVAAAVLAVLTAPLVGAVLLAPAAYRAAERSRASGTGWRGVAQAAALCGAAVGLAVAASGAGPLAGRAAPVIPTPTAVAAIVGGLVVVGVGWRVRWARPLLAPTVLVLGVLLVPGPGRAAAALLGLALVGTVVALVVDDVAVRLPARRRALVGAVAAAAVVTVLTTAALSAPRPDGPAPTSPAPLLAWAQDRTDPGAVLHADPLDRAELVAAGFPPDRLGDLGTPVADADVVLRSARDDAPPARCAAGTERATLPRWGGAPAAICGARAPDVDPDPAGRPSRVRIGTALAGNPGLRLDPAAADLLRRGEVDPRVMVVLAALTGSHTLAVTDFPAAALEPADVVRRRVLVSAVDGRPAAGDAPSPLRPWLDGQYPPYAPTVLRDERGGLVFGYRDPAPAGVLPR